VSVYTKPYAERDGSEFAVYPNLTIEYRDASHRYWLHADGERKPTVSVTGALKVLDKPALLSWAERCGAEGAARLAKMGELDNVMPEAAIEFVRMHKLGMDAKRDAGADRGTAAHTVLETWMADGTIPKLGDFEADERGYVKGLSRFLITHEPEPVAIEVIVGSVKHDFAGRLDMIANLGGRRLLIDLKTSPWARIYPEAHMQTCGYSLALPECGIEPVDGILIVAVAADGEFVTSEGFAEDQDFLNILATHRSMGRLRAAVKEHELLTEATA